MFLLFNVLLWPTLLIGSFSAYADIAENGFDTVLDIDFSVQVRSYNVQVLLSCVCAKRICRLGIVFHQLLDRTDVLFRIAEVAAASSVLVAMVATAFQVLVAVCSHTRWFFLLSLDA